MMYIAVQLRSIALIFDFCHFWLSIKIFLYLKNVLIRFKLAFKISTGAAS